MTREEFIEEITNLDELYDFCYGEDIESLMEDYLNEENSEASDWIEESISNREGGWMDLRESLNELYDQYEGATWYYVGNGELEACDDGCFESIKQEVLEYCDERRIFRNGDEDEDEEPEEIEEVIEESVTYIEIPVDGIPASTFTDVEKEPVMNLYYIGGAKSESVKIL